MKNTLLNMNMAVFTTRNVVLKGLTITKVYHDEDGSWQFFDSDSTNSYQNAMIVSLEEILKIDQSVLDILEMMPSHRAERLNKNQAWIISEYS